MFLEVNIYLRLTLNACICLIADFRDVCYNLTNYVLEDKGSLGNHRWVEVTFGEDCVAGLIIEEHKMTEEEPFSACYTFQYKRYMYFGDHERPPTCTPAMYEYHVIFTLSKDPDENVKQMYVISSPG
eukprot:XP_019925333.1 PREDICTED: uncharacterized protein LOC105334336 [Crassostrea gigas]